MPYLWLAVAGLLVGGPVLFTRRSAAVLSVFWFAESLVFTANYAVMDLMELYYYRPWFLADYVADNTLGIFLAELGFVGFLALWVVYTLPPLLGAVAGTVVVVGIEFFFRRWGIFLGNGWQLWHTAAVFPFYFLAIYLFKGLAERHGAAAGWIRTATRVNLALWWSHFLGMVAYWITVGVVMQVRILPTFARNQTLGAILTVGPWLNGALLWVLAGRAEQRVIRLLWSAAGLLLIGWFWVLVGLWRFRSPWNLYVHTGAQVAAIWLAVLCDEWISRWAETRAAIR